jgi:hypothetical protein
MRVTLYLKNIVDWLGRQGLSNGTPLEPPLLWLDSIFNVVKDANYDERHPAGKKS